MDTTSIPSNSFSMDTKISDLESTTLAPIHPTEVVTITNALSKTTDKIDYLITTSMFDRIETETSNSEKIEASTVFSDLKLFTSIDSPMESSSLIESSALSISMLESKTFSNHETELISSTLTFSDEIFKESSTSRIETFFTEDSTSTLIKSTISESNLTSTIPNQRMGSTLDISKNASIFTEFLTEFSSKLTTTSEFILTKALNSMYDFIYLL